MKVDLSIFYFCAYGAAGALMSFLPLILRGRGFDGAEIAMVMMVAPIGHLMIPPLWGVLADRLDARVWLLRIASIGSAFGTMALYPTQTVVGAVLAMVGYCLFRSPVFPLVDATAVAVLGDQRDKYAQIRVWGSVGFAGFAVLAGAIGGSTRPDRLFAIGVLLQFGAAIATMRFVAPPRTDRPGVVGELRSFLGTSRLPLVFLATAIYYSAHSTYDIAFSLQMRALGHDDQFLGLALGLAVAAEVAMMFAAPKLLDRFDPAKFLIGASVVSAIRWALIAVLTSEWAILLTQPLHGITFGAWYVALVKFVHDRAPAHLRTSLQAGIMAALGLGSIVGYWTGGVTFDASGGPTVFAMASALSGVALMVYALAAWRERAADSQVAT